MIKPTLVFVPGIWVGPVVYDSVTATLRDPHGYTTTAISLPSTGKESPNAPSMKDDADAIRAGIEPLLDEGKELVLILHSAGGFLGSDAIEGLGVEARAKVGQKGGVRKLVFLAAALPDVGFDHGSVSPPNFQYVGERMYCKDPIPNLFNDLPPEEAESWAKRLSFQPAHGWDGVISYTAWKDVPSTYLICDNDAVVPPALQKHWAENAGCEIVTCSAGHMPMLSQPEKVVEVIRRAAGEKI
ncbi:hypothetical protein MMC11_006426 [Xylographa trunciseda]|nr:hypothetical protein [Xylographa trunciseda]